MEELSTKHPLLKEISKKFLNEENFTEIKFSKLTEKDIINIKISKLGGLTKSKILRDLCVECNIPMTIEDSWGGHIATSAIAHLAHSTPVKYRFSSTDFNSYNSITYTIGSPQ